jgi:16S rRNA (adenine1518-N6/adenine1519-N6)-dimethyltransferase
MASLTDRTEGGCTALIMAKSRALNESKQEPSSDVKRLLRAFNASPRKALGQHFLIDKDRLQDILDAASLTSEDTVIEIGPGIGIMTRELAARAGHVIAVEKDRVLAEGLSKNLSHLNNVLVVIGDARDINMMDLLGDTSSYKVVANLPYYAASPIVRRFLESKVPPTSMVFMMQKEVAQNMVAGPGDLSIIGVATQFYGKPRIVSYVSPSAFYPPPNVKSAIVHIEVYRRPAIDVDDPSLFFYVVRSGFAAPRKRLSNSLSLGLSITPSATQELLALAGVSTSLRPQDLYLEQWAQIYRVINSVGVSAIIKGLRKNQPDS